MRAKLIYEKFIEDSDPIYDMGIGIKVLIEKWLEKMEISDYVINKNLSIDLLKNVNLEHKDIVELPSYIKFYKTKNFYIHLNPLVSLKGCPKYVYGSFACSYTPIASLRYSPKYVQEVYYIHDCPNLKTLDGIKHVGERLCMQNNNISKKEINNLLKKVRVRSVYWTNPKTNITENLYF